MAKRPMKPLYEDNNDDFYVGLLLLVAGAALGAGLAAVVMMFDMWGTQCLTH